jgi:hypothetical protein
MFKNAYIKYNNNIPTHYTQYYIMAVFCTILNVIHTASPQEEPYIQIVQLMDYNKNSYPFTHFYPFHPPFLHHIPWSPNVHKLQH